jgi:AraC-like DNA-binding protein
MSLAVRSIARDVSEDVYEVVAPAPPLRPFVENLWVHHVPARSDNLHLLPDGRMELVWTREMGVYVVGPQSRWFDRPVPSPMVAFGVRFWPGAAPGLLRVAAHEVVNGRLPLADVDPLLAARIDHRLDRARYDDEAFAVLDEELVRRLDLSPRPDAAVAEAVDLLDGGASVAEVAERVYISERQLQRRFVDHVGYGPKTLQRILRFQRAVNAIADGWPVGRAAALAGYADEPHLFRESRRIAARTPSELGAYRH